MKKLALISLSLLLLSAFNEAAEEPQEEMQEEIMEEVMEDENIKEFTSQLSAIEGHEGSGMVLSYFHGGEYFLEADFDDLAPLEDGFFYEGWVVRSEPLSVVSTGALEEIDESFVNNFKSDSDLTDHQKYILTLEPDDGDPAPAEHVLEGTFE